MQKRAARFMTRNYSRETGNVTGIFDKLKWEILQLRKGGRIIGSYYCKKVCNVKTKFMQMTLSQNRCCRNQHLMAYQISYASKDAYGNKWKQQVLPLKLTKSNSTPTSIRKVKDQPLRRIAINGTENIRNLG